MQAGADVVDATKGGVYSGTRHQIPAAVVLYLVEDCGVLKRLTVVQRCFEGANSKRPVVIGHSREGRIQRELRNRDL